MAALKVLTYFLILWCFTYQIQNALGTGDNEENNLKPEVFESDSMQQQLNDISTFGSCGQSQSLPESCEDAMRNTCQSEGIYQLNIPGSGLSPFSVKCKLINNEIWTIIQRREDGSVDFYRNWVDYKNGFGSLYGEYWLGLERIHQMLRRKRHELYILMENQQGQMFYARYANVQIADETEKYKINFGGFCGNTTDEMTGTSLSIYTHQGMKFSTKDNDNDNWIGSCAQQHTGAWWFNACMTCHLNGQYEGAENGFGVYWYTIGRTLKSSLMAIRQSNSSC